MVSTIEMTRDGFVGIFVCYGAKMSSKSVGKTTAIFTNVEFAAFMAGNAINFEEDLQVKLCRMTKSDLGLEIKVVVFRKAHV